MKVVRLSLLAITSVFSVASASMSAKGVELLEKFESFRPTIYLDAGKKPTIGFGHLLTAKEKKDGSYDGVRISEEEARELFMDDIREKANVSEYVTVDLKSNQFDALASLCFNIGKGAFKSSDVVKRVNDEDIGGACEYFGHWRRADGVILPGLVKRRFTELMVFADQALDPDDNALPSDQWNVDLMPVTNENWRSLGVKLRNEAVELYTDYADR